MTTLLINYSIFSLVNNNVPLMNYINYVKLRTISSLVIILSTSSFLIACGSAAKKDAKPVLSKSVVTNTVITKSQLDEPSFAYLVDSTKVGNTRLLSSEAWLTIAKDNFQSKHYARALRAANEALSVDNKLVAARQLAMLSAVKVTENSIDSYHDNTLMSNSDKDRFKSSLTSMTTLVNASDD